MIIALAVLLGLVLIHVVGFTAAEAVPPRWSLAVFLPFLLLVLGCVVWLVRRASLAEEVSPDRPLELAD